MRHSMIARPGSCLLLALALAGCSDGLVAPFGRRPALVAPESATAERIRGQDPTLAPLTPEAGNVWPDAEPERATLMNPDRDTFREDVTSPALERAARERGRAPQPRLPDLSEPGPGLPPSAAPNPRNPPPGTTLPSRRPSTTPPDNLSTPPLPYQPGRLSIPAQPGDPATPPAPRQDGRTIFTPDGVPNTTTGGTDAVQGITRPGGASGTATPLGNSTVITVPGQSPQIVPDRQ